MSEEGFRAVIDIIVNDEQLEASAMRNKQWLEMQKKAANELGEALTQAYQRQMYAEAPGAYGNKDDSVELRRMAHEQALMTQQQYPQQFQQYANKYSNIKEPRGGPSYESMDARLSQWQQVFGAASNVVHAYYWIESAAIRLENAEIRVTSAQEALTKAIKDHGSRSLEAAQASRTLEIAENNLQRAHAREILNIALVGAQATYAVRNILNLAKGMGLLRTTTDAATASTAAFNVVSSGTGGLGGAVATGAAGAGASRLTIGRVVGAAGAGGAVAGGTAGVTGGGAGILSILSAHPLALAAIAVAAIAVGGLLIYRQQNEDAYFRALEEKRNALTPAAGEDLPPHWQLMPGTLPSERVNAAAVANDITIAVPKSSPVPAPTSGQIFPSLPGGGTVNPDYSQYRQVPPISSSQVSPSTQGNNITVIVQGSNITTSDLNGGINSAMDRQAGNIKSELRRLLR